MPWIDNEILEVRRTSQKGQTATICNLQTGGFLFFSGVFVLRHIVSYVCDSLPGKGFQKGDSMRKVVVDVETTGFSTLRGGRVIEIGAVAVANGVIVAELGTLIDTGAEISYGAFRVHGISEAMLEGKPAPREVWGAFREFVGDAELIAHNSPFDSAFVRHELGLIGHGLPNRWHCTVRLARRHLPHLPNHRLDTVYTHLFGEIPDSLQRHRALDDARLTARVWVELTKNS
jgi:DNA polymerase III subunit epsilon